MQANGQHPRVVPERRLHAVAVMGVHVDVGDPLRPLAQQPRDRDGRVVVNAETAGAAGHGVVQATRDAGAVLRGRRPDRPGRGQRGSRHHGGRLVHAGEHRIVGGTEPVHQQHAAGQFLLVRGLGFGTARQLHQADIGGVVNELELGGGRRGRNLHRDPVRAAEAEGLSEFHSQLESDRRHRMAGTEVVAGQPVIPGHVQGAGHDGPLRIGSVPADGVSRLP